MKFINLSILFVSIFALPLLDVHNAALDVTTDESANFEPNTFEHAFEKRQPLIPGIIASAVGTEAATKVINTDTLKPVSSTIKKVATKENLKKASKAVSKTASKAGQEVVKAGKAVGNTVSKAGKAVGKVASKAGKAVGNTVSKAGKAVGKVASKAGKEIANTTKKAANAVVNTVKKIPFKDILSVIF